MMGTAAVMGTAGTAGTTDMTGTTGTAATTAMATRLKIPTVVEAGLVGHRAVSASDVLTRASGDQRRLLAQVDRR